MTQKKYVKKDSHTAGGINNDGIKIFVGGGMESPKSVECFDILTEKWIELPDTQSKFEDNPLLFVNKESRFIGMLEKHKGIEILDLRTNKWNCVVNGPNLCDCIGEFETLVS